MPPVFGHVPGNPPGTTYPSRQAVSDALVHTPTQGGIWGTAVTGARSIVVSGGYPDDEDYGDLIVYTGQGGQGPSRRQVADQVYTRGNAGLVRSCTDGLPVRVVRGAGGKPEFSPTSGYRYDGLYRVDEYWQERGQDGFLICRYRLVAIGEDDPGTVSPTPLGTPALPAGGPAPRQEVMQQRIIRNTAAVRRVKALHDHGCQVCGLTITVPGGVPYAEGAHIKPLGRPHDGPDNEQNILCLCPNHHAMFDLGVISIGPTWDLMETATGTTLGPLRRKPGHTIDGAHVAYHREMFKPT